MIGKIYKIRFCCDNPIGETWYHNLWKLFTPLYTIHIAERTGEPFIIEVNKGYIKDTIEQIENMGSDIEEWTPNVDKFYGTNLCGFGGCNGICQECNKGDE